MKTINNILFFFLILFLTSCMDLGSTPSKHVVGEFYILLPDPAGQITLSYQNQDNKGSYWGVVGAMVFSVGYNEKYIIAKQHPQTFPKSPNLKITNYYIVPIDMYVAKTHQVPIGPLTLEQFNEKRKELNIEKVKFAWEY